MKREKMIELRGKRSQSEIAEILGMSQQFYSLIENGERGIHPKYFKKMETVFNNKMEVIAPDIFLTSKTT
ncbi:MAG: helix-turn-helix transcriptional regulator [Clostridia bacterium]|nr:helix-turn-helix transcriptional regulator [Clostridia bacterium]